MAPVPFIELDFTARVQDGPVFDTSYESVAKENHLHGKTYFTPLIVPFKEGYLLPGLYAFLKDKEAGSYSVTIPAQDAFGVRDAKLIKLVPASSFRKEKMTPQVGMEIEVSGRRGVVKNVSGGRVLVDLNHPLAGKTVVYDVEYKGNVNDLAKCVEAYLFLTLQIPKTLLECSSEGKTVRVGLKFKEELPQEILDEFSKIAVEMIEGLEGVTFFRVEGADTETS